MHFVLQLLAYALKNEIRNACRITLFHIWVDAGILLVYLAVCMKLFDRLANHNHSFIIQDISEIDEGSQLYRKVSHLGQPQPYSFNQDISRIFVVQQPWR